MMDVGGYFGLEIQQRDHYHKNAIKLNTARNCFEYVLRVRKYSKIYIPFYICEVMLEPLRKCNVEYEFYHINEKMEPAQKYQLKLGEAFLYTNYFGLKGDCVGELASTYGTQLVVDNSQAFFELPIEGIDTFYSARKFFGVADGAYLYTTELLEEELVQDRSYERMNHLLKRIDVDAEFGYEDFHINEGSLKCQPIMKMSNLTDAILRTIDYDFCKKRRLENFKCLDRMLRHKNLFRISQTNDFVPMVYPFLSNDNFLRDNLIKNNIYVAKYWDNVLCWCAKTDFESSIANKLSPLPIDQRYSITEMKKIVQIICK